MSNIYSDVEHLKMIGVYESRAAVEDAVKRLADKPVFRDNPESVLSDDD